MRERRQPAICNPGSWSSAAACRLPSDSRGTPDALASTQMKDLVLMGISAAFFALAWVYARSFDHL